MWIWDDFPQQPQNQRLLSLISVQSFNIVIEYAKDLKMQLEKMLTMWNQHWGTETNL